MNIQNAQGFASAIKILGSRSAGFKSVLGDVVGYAYNQAVSNGNSSPLMVIRDSMPNWVKPSGCTIKALDSFVADYCGFEWNKESKSYKKIPGKNLRELPEQGVKFWDYAKEETEPKRVTVEQDIARAIARAVKQGGWTQDSFLSEVAKQVAASELKDVAELAAVLGIAA
jgi:hypothetical protein